MPGFTSLAVAVAPACEPVSLAMAKKHLRLDFNDDDDLVSMYLTAARTWAEDYLGRALITQQLLSLTADKPFTGAFPYVVLPFPVAIYPLWYPWPDAMNYPHELPRAPVQSVDQISYGVWGSPDAVIDPAFYNLDVGLGRVRFLAGAFPSPHDHIATLFTAGYGDTGQSVPQNIVAGILMLLGLLYENRGDAPAEMPMAAKALLTMHRRIGFGS